MGNEEIIRLFKLFIGQDFIDVYDLKLNIEKLSNDNKSIIFSIDNQKDISYHQNVVNEFLTTYLRDFFNYTNIELQSFIDSEHELYFNDELKDKITNILKNIKEIKVSDDDFNDELITIMGEHTKFDLTYSSDRIIIYNTFNPHQGYIKSIHEGHIKTSNLPDVIKKYYRFCNRMSTGFESDEIYNQIDGILNEYPLINESDIAFYYHTKFI